MRRREFLRGSLGVVALGSLARTGQSAGPDSIGNPFGASSITASRPILRVPLNPRSVFVDGVPFAPEFSGDGFPKLNIPFHSPENLFPGGSPPTPEEEVDVAVVGGGISGLTTAYLLREHNTVLFELHPRCGGAAQGEIWGGTAYSYGNAYVITPDPGTFLNDFYLDLGLDKVVRPDVDEEFTLELGGKIMSNFISGDHPPEEQAAFDRYLEILSVYSGERYPDIPFPADQKDLVHELDGFSLKTHIEQEMNGLEIPRVLESLIQSYCYSSFAAGWEEISAAGGWNFLAAEVFGRWVFPGGNAYMADQIWKKLVQKDRALGKGRPTVRGSSRVVDVRLLTNGRVQVTYVDPNKEFRSVSAKRVAMCCPKFIAKNVIHDIETIDPAKRDAMDQIDYRPYLVANVLLDGRFNREFYDIFLLGDGEYPRNTDEAEQDPFITDMLNGHYAREKSFNRSVLTLYWPIPYPGGRFTLIVEEAWRNYAENIVAQLDSILSHVGMTRSAIRQVRMTRWGHAMPLHRPGLIVNGTVDELRRPYEGKVYFVQEDNWALPAVENCLLDAEIFAPQIAAGL